MMGLNRAGTPGPDIEPTDPTLLTASELAAYLGLSHQRVLRMLAARQILAPVSWQPDPSGCRWDADEVRRWADQQWWGARSWRQAPSYLERA